MRKALLLLLVPLILSGCRKEGFVPYAGKETGQVRNGVIVTDNGVNLVVDANPGNYKLTTDRRVVVSYKATASDGPDTYRIDLEELWETSRIEPIAEPSGEHYDDPVRIDEAWFSGGYLNVEVAYDGTEPSLHLFPATYEKYGRSLAADQAVQVTGRLSVRDDEDIKLIADVIEDHIYPEITFTYFVPDIRKDGGYGVIQAENPIK